MWTMRKECVIKVLKSFIIILRMDFDKNNNFKVEHIFLCNLTFEKIYTFQIKRLIFYRMRSFVIVHLQHNIKRVTTSDCKNIGLEKVSVAKTLFVSISNFRQFYKGTVHSLLLKL